MHQRNLITPGILVLIAALILIPSIAGGAPVTANFVVDADTGMAPFTARFTDTSVEAASWSWDFGDGQTSAIANPVHIYTNPGTYTVSLTIHDSTGSLTDTKTVPDLMVIMSDSGSIPYSAATVPPTQVIVTTSSALPSTTTTVPTTTTTPVLAGSIEVVSVPAGSMMLLDGIEQGTTPITAYNVPIGSHTVRIHTKGYVDNETTVMVEHQKTVNLRVILFANDALNPSSVSTPTAALTETPMAEIQKSAAYRPAPVSLKPGNGSVLFLCENCDLSQSVDLDGNRMRYSKGMIFDNVPEGAHRLFIIDSSRTCTQSWYKFNVSTGEETTVKGRACTPGFTTFLAVLAIAGIAGYRRFVR